MFISIPSKFFFNCGSVYTALEQNPRRTSRGDEKSTNKVKQLLNALRQEKNVTFCFWVFEIIFLLFFPHMNTFTPLVLSYSMTGLH